MKPTIELSVFGLRNLPGWKHSAHDWPVLKCPVTRSEAANKRKIIIYGAGRNAALLLYELASNEHLMLAPLGYIDDDPYKRKKIIYGYPVLGTYAELADVVRKTAAEEIVVVFDGMETSRLIDLAAWCERNSLGLKKMRLSLDVVDLTGSASCSVVEANRRAT